MLGLLNRPRRVSLWAASLCAAAAAAAAHADSFWAMVLLGIAMLWAMIAALPLVDLNWRMRTGLVISTCLLAGLALWPSLNTMTQGYLPCPDYIKQKVSFRLVAGLDLRGGLRLVYTVDVDEAIKDKRDHYHEDMRNELAKIYVGHEGDDAPSEELVKKLATMVELSKPRDSANSVMLTI